MATPNGSHSLSEGAESIHNGHMVRDTSCTSSGTHRQIMMEEVAPSAASILDAEIFSWQVPLEWFTTKRRGKERGDKALPRSVRRYYKTQDELITTFEELQLEVDDAMENTNEKTSLRRKATFMSKVSFVCNLFLLIIKTVAACLSGSLSVLSSVIDSGVDLASGILIWWSNRAIKKRDLYQYPQGRTRLEPIAIVILSVIMSLASVQMVREAVENIIFYTVHSGIIRFQAETIAICLVTIGVKVTLYVFCRRFKSSSLQALSQDHRNDVLSNTVALVCGYIGYEVWRFADPLGAIIISLYIIISWAVTGWEQIKMLTGHTARPEFLKKITWIALNHHQKVLLIDTVRAFHFGNNFLVEVDIVLPEKLTLKESHDIGESLQHKIERLPEVERAFVHLDHEANHAPWSEHKIV
ncbi:metal tolerance protein 4-like isoform X1 [Limulus polyphemus]|uniref:Metal tolerance protein 4-like isoform X1 n=2 Tax=Limulus polyphemus TaxID=6850 RepID=A0ABM1TMT7_LIMPO|nr:metal tolerance protein 4-like isoform X1 [Limulus polyphemus]XP_022257194.1 metal tolerance protein 4-like isoform X1 [Limulus polyphemus]